MTEPVNPAALNLARWRADPRCFVREVFQVQPDAWQDEALLAFPQSPRLAMKACAGPGKAQPKDTVIPTPEGRRRFGDLRPGDRVFTADGSITTVRAVHDRGVLPVYRVAFDDGSATLACGEHLWRVRGRTERRHYKVRRSTKWNAKTEARAAAQGWPVTPADGYVVLTTEQIIERNRTPDGKRRQFEVPRQGAAQYPRRRLKVDPYVLGVWLGDGCRRTGRYATKPTNEIQAEIQRRGYDAKLLAPYPAVQVYGLREKLRALGLDDFYSYQRFVPEDYLFASINDRTDLLCGLMDTDGGIDADGHMQFATTSPRLAEDVIWLARSLGGSAHRAKIKTPFYYGPDGEKIPGRLCHRVVLRLPFNPFRVPERKARWRDPAVSPKTLRYMTRMIDRIESAGEADCMCIEVEHSSSLYLTNDFIVTHNSTLLAWIGWNFLLTRPNPDCAVTSINGANLKANLWKELGKWRDKAPLLKQAFEMTSNQIYLREKPLTWKMEARTWARDATPDQIGNALRGLHGDYVLWLADETGGYPDAILPVLENIFSGAPKEAHIVQAGNPTHIGGPLYRACTKARSLWTVVTITGDPDDPRRSPRISLQHAREQIAQYGRQNPFVLVNIFGEFPPSSFNSLIGPDEVDAAMKRYYRDYQIGNAPKIMGVDVARYGDDSSVIARRWGIQMLPFKQVRNADSNSGGGWVAREWDDWQADACFVDDTGGYGSGWIDALRRIGKAPIGVGYGKSAHDVKRYANKRAEMAFAFVQWIKDGGALPEQPELSAALTSTQYTFTPKGQLIVEPKEDVKTRLGYSPDHMDAAMETFAEPVTAKGTRRPGSRATTALPDNYDPNHDLPGQRPIYQ